MFDSFSRSRGSLSRISHHKTIEIRNYLIPNNRRPIPLLYAIQRKDVNPDSRAISPINIVFDNCCPRINNFKKRVYRRSIPIRNQLYTIAEIIFHHIRVESFIIASRHSDINIIIPRNIASMANSAQQGARRKIVSESLFSTNLIDFNEQIKLQLLSFIKRYLFQGLTPNHVDSN